MGAETLLQRPLAGMASMHMGRNFIVHTKTKKIETIQILLNLAVSKTCRCFN